MDETRRERLRGAAKRLFPGIEEMPEEVIARLDRILAIEERREEPIWKSPEKLWRTIAAIVAIAGAVGSLVFGYATTTASVAELREASRSQSAQIAENREEAKADLRNLESRLDRNLSGVNDKLDRLLLFLTENASRP